MSHICLPARIRHKKWAHKTHSKYYWRLNANRQNLNRYQHLTVTDYLNDPKTSNRLTKKPQKGAFSILFYTTVL